MIVAAILLIVVVPAIVIIVVFARPFARPARRNLTPADEGREQVAASFTIAGLLNDTRARNRTQGMNAAAILRQLPDSLVLAGQFDLTRRDGAVDVHWDGKIRKLILEVTSSEWCLSAWSSYQERPVILGSGQHNKARRAARIIIRHLWTEEVPLGAA